MLSLAPCSVVVYCSFGYRLRYKNTIFSMRFPTLRPSPHPRYAFEVTAPASLFGRPIRRFFTTRSSAQVFLTDLQARVSRDAVSPITREEQLLLSRHRSSLTVADMESALAAASERKATASRSLGRCLEDYVTDARQRNADGSMSDLHLRDIRRNVKLVNTTSLAARPLPDLTFADIESCLDSLKERLAPRTRINLLAHLRTAFSFFRRQGWVRSTDAVSLARRPSVPASLPGIVSPLDMVSLLRTSLSLSDTRCLCWLVFSGFCGLRTSEVLRLRWSDIRWGEGQLYVSPGKTKNAERWVSLTPPALALRSLLGEPAEGGRVIPEDMKRTRARLVARAGVTLGDNALRHSFGSYHLVGYSLPDTTALEMGHHSPAQTFNAYRRAVTKAQAAAWWGIVPAFLTSPPTLASVE